MAIYKEYQKINVFHIDRWIWGSNEGHFPQLNTKCGERKRPETYYCRHKIFSNALSNFGQGSL